MGDEEPREAVVGARSSLETEPLDQGLGEHPIDGALCDRSHARRSAHDSAGARAATAERDLEQRRLPAPFGPTSPIRAPMLHDEIEPGEELAIAVPVS